ncbi:MAG: hypothetical protein JJU45_16470 [Acidimicrobiia bacterium]|nr:hypothetical protein [Acidimicrobiia bacterium]
MTTVERTDPEVSATDAQHHSVAAAGNRVATEAALTELLAVLDRRSDTERILLRAAAGAGKSHALKHMVTAALEHLDCERIGVVAFANKQLFPLARDLGRQLGRDRVCLRISPRRFDSLDAATTEAATVATANADIPDEVEVLVMTSHMGGQPAWGILNTIGPTPSGDLFDVLFVDEAWQLPIHLYRAVERHARVVVGVGDVGQLPPLDRANNPYRGDGKYNPYRAWPDTYQGDPETWSIEMPAVWRPTAAQLPMWRAFYKDWDRLDCVAAPGDRSVTFGDLSSPAAEVWTSVAAGTPTLVEVDGLEPPDAPDVDPPLMAVVETWLDELVSTGATCRRKVYDDQGEPEGEEAFSFEDANETVVAVLATRNQAVEDAEAMVERLRERHDLPPDAIVASTVDSWQGQTNALTVATHPLSGASELDEFNSSFGRLAVTCTRATHGLLLVARCGLDEMLADASARPGAPFGEPGPRALPRQTHQRILATFARISVAIE